VWHCDVDPVTGVCGTVHKIAAEYQDADNDWASIAVDPTNGDL